LLELFWCILGEAILRYTRYADLGRARAGGALRTQCERRNHWVHVPYLCRGWAWLRVGKGFPYRVPRAPSCSRPHRGLRA